MCTWAVNPAKDICFDLYISLQSLYICFLFSHCHIFLVSNCMEAHLQRWNMAALHRKWDKWYSIFFAVLPLISDSCLNMLHQMYRFHAFVISKAILHGIMFVFSKRPIVVHSYIVIIKLQTGDQLLLKCFQCFTKFTLGNIRCVTT